MKMSHSMNIILVLVNLISLCSSTKYIIQFPADQLVQTRSKLAPSNWHPHLSKMEDLDEKHGFKMIDGFETTLPATLLSMEESKFLKKRPLPKMQCSCKFTRLAKQKKNSSKSNAHSHTVKTSLIEMNSKPHQSQKAKTVTIPQASSVTTQGLQTSAQIPLQAGIQQVAPPQITMQQPLLYSNPYAQQQFAYGYNTGGYTLQQPITPPFVQVPQLNYQGQQFPAPSPPQNSLKDKEQEELNLVGTLMKDIISINKTTQQQEPNQIVGQQQAIPQVNPSFLQNFQQPIGNTYFPQQVMQSPGNNAFLSYNQQ